MPSGRDIPDGRPGLPWLIRLRWLAVLGQLAATAAALFLVETVLSLPWVLGLIATLALSNLALTVHLRRRPLPAPIPRPKAGPDRLTALILAVLALDTVLLTALLLASGGPMNPFSIFYIVQVALAGLLVGAGGAWSMAALSSLGFGLLFVLTPEDPHAHHRPGADILHLHGMLVAYTLAAAFSALFISGIASALRRRDRELAELRERALETERMASLASFSAAAAHELGTPLSTIAVVATELADTLESQPLVDSSDARRQLADDARLVRREVERCRTLLRDLSERSGAWAGEGPERLPWPRLATALQESLPVGGHARLTIRAPTGLELTLPRRSLVQSLSNLVKNALTYSGEAPVELEVSLHGDRVRFAVRDRGPGLPAAILGRLGEPFNAGPGSGGLGLGLHLARAFCDKVGGSLTVHPRPGGGTELVLDVPSRASTASRPTP